MDIKQAKKKIDRAAKLSTSKDIDDLFLAQALCEQVDKHFEGLDEVKQIQSVLEYEKPHAWKRYWKKKGA